MSYYRNNELYHFGVKGMKWGVRRYQNKDGSLTAAGKKRRNQYLDKTESMAKAHKATAQSYKKSTDRLLKMSDSDYAKMYDDKEYLQSLGGAKKAKNLEIAQYKQRYKDYISYSKDWMDAHDEIMNTPESSLVNKRDYKEIISKYMNR